MKLKVKHHNPWKNKLILILIVIALVAGSIGLYDYGRFMAGYDSSEAGKQLTKFVEINDELDDEILTLREQKAQLERAAQIEQQAYSELNASIKVLQGEILELKGELAFYRGIVSPKDASRGLHLQSFSLTGNGNHSFRYKVVLTQVLKNDRLAHGLVHLRVDGLMNDQPKTLHLAAIAQPTVKELSYRFKYFQNLEGNLNLPVTFRPLRASIQVLPSGRKTDMIEKTINWPNEEALPDVEKEEET